MTINAMLNQHNMTKYRLAKESGIPHATISDICSGKAQIEKCSAETLYKIAKVLSVSIEDLIRDRMEAPQERRSTFDVFKSNVCHRVKDIGDIDFIIEVLESNAIRQYYEKKWMAECLYLLAMVDYLSRENDLPICVEYNDLRSKKLAKPLYPLSVVLADAVSQTTIHADRSYKAAIPEFLRFNIVESDIRNVV